jgi:glycine C-acetyltransferase
VLVDLLRQRARPYLFSNSLAPAIVAATLEVLDMIERGDELRRRLQHNARRFRAGMKKLGFTLAGADHPIIPVMIGDAVKAQEFAASLLDQGIYVVAFAYPVVPRGQARIRTQMSAIHSDDQIDHAIGLFGSVGRDLGLI